MNRVWYRIEDFFAVTSTQLINAGNYYPVAMACMGGGWQNGPVLGFGMLASTIQFQGSCIERLESLLKSHSDWIFGHAGYNLKKETESVECRFPNEDGFSDVHFFVPEIVVLKKNGEWYAGCTTREMYDVFLHNLQQHENGHPPENLQLVPGTSREKYLQNVRSLLNHIHLGNIYEINYCVEFSAVATLLNPVDQFEALEKITEAPFSCLYRNNSSWLMSASPERYVCKSGNVLKSQPIKGTAKRSTDPVEDIVLKTTLLNNQKERSENVMIVDLVRNDLSRIALRGSVKVSELFGIYTFKTVHQMISTIECEVTDSTTLADVLRATFPMGSMTGAPKISAMRLAEQHEDQSRGIYSGCVGYITPDGDFDFNVVIRSITWNSESGHVSVKAGSAITANSIPEQEYEECLLKAAAMMNALKRV